MSYYRLLGLHHEPFSTSPDPAFFYLSPVHRAALFRLRSSIALQRGLSLVVGDIGTGKTTLARCLSQMLLQDPRMELRVILNPMYQERGEFLQNLVDVFRIGDCGTGARPVACLETIERFLFQKGIEQGQTVVLVIDEAQQLSPHSLEVLRALLNYETNDHKLLQVVLFGQMELGERLREAPNFWDRISFKAHLAPLDENATRQMVLFRLEQARGEGAEPLFTRDALRCVYRKTRGFPRRITMLCHDALEYCVMTDQRQVTKQVVQAAAKRERVFLAAVS